MKALRALFLVLLIGSIARSAEVATLSGKKLNGEVVSVDAKTVTVKVEGGGEQSFAVTDLVLVDLGNATKDPGSAKYADVELIDGTVLHCADFKVQGKTTTLTLLAGAKDRGLTIRVPNTSLFYVIRDAHDAKNRLDFQTTLNRRGKRDLLVLKRGGVLDGVEGTFGDGDAEGQTIAFESANGQKLTPFQRSVHGMVFNQLPTGEKPPTVCKVIDVNRNVLYAKSVAVKGKGVSVTTVSGVTVDYPDLKDVSKLDFSSGVLRYLSDLDPARVEFSTGIGSEGHYGRDRNLDSSVSQVEPIRIEGTTYPKGLAVHATTVITYDIGGDYKEFRTTLGVDDTANPDSASTLLIEGDGRELFKGVVKRKDKPRPLTVDVRSVKQLRITVGSEGLDLGNQLSLADAKVTK